MEKWSGPTEGICRGSPTGPVQFDRAWKPPETYLDATWA